MSTSKMTSAGYVFALLAGLACGAQASPVIFTTSHFDTTAFAISGALADVQSAASPTPLPLLSNATVVGINDFATASAFGSTGLLFTSAEGDTFAGGVGASAGAQAHFVGTFLGSGHLTLDLGFVNLTSLAGSGSADATLFVLVTHQIGGITTQLFNNFFSVGSDILLDLMSTGGTNTIDLVLFSEAASFGAGQSGQNFAQVTYAVSLEPEASVPTPATLPLVVGGLLALLGARGRRPSHRRDEV